MRPRGLDRGVVRAAGHRLAAAAGSCAVVRHGQEVPATCAKSFRLLGDRGVVDEQPAAALQRSARMRNLLDADHLATDHRRSAGGQDR